MHKHRKIFKINFCFLESFILYSFHSAYVVDSVRNEDQSGSKHTTPNAATLQETITAKNKQYAENSQKCEYTF